MYENVCIYVCMYVGECTVQCPRLPGECEVACIATADGSTTMASEKIAIIDPQNKAGIYCMYVCMYVCMCALQEDYSVYVRIRIPYLYVR